MCVYNSNRSSISIFHHTRQDMPFKMFIEIHRHINTNMSVSM